MDYRKENDIVLNKWFEQVLVKSWTDTGRDERTKSASLELIISPYCNLGCKYCYIHKFHHKLYPAKIYDKEKVLKNTELVINWLIKNKYKPQIELFSGEIFAQEIGFQVLELLYEKYKSVSDDAKIRVIVIPTNFTFILDDSLTKRVADLIEKFRGIGIRIGLSASFDGKYVESNRPYLRNIDFKLDSPRDDKYYDKCFEFIKHYKCGLHPMVYSQNIELWKDNFLWFQSMMEKHGIPWTRLYLLQVRNGDWTPRQNKALYDFVRWLTNWSFNKLGRDKDAYVKFLREYPYGFNILKSGLGKNNRGLPCSIQYGAYIRLGDLALVPCHRTMYSGLEFGYFVVEDDEIVGIRSENPEMALAIMTYDYRNGPYCTSCMIRDICTGGCLGSQLEVTGDLFTPIPTMCAMQHALAVGILRGLLDIGVYTRVIAQMTPKQFYQFEQLRKELSKYEL